jgi:hypothetical protein
VGAKEHITNQADFDPIECGLLEELGLLERTEQELLIERLGRTVMQFIQHPALEKLLIRDTHYTWAQKTHTINKRNCMHDFAVLLGCVYGRTSERYTFDRMLRWAMLEVPTLDERHIQRTTHAT